ncbi:hypothetical protein LshimejAT787_0601410 [Lyophyllum shimeji]|uniref:DUF6533 domain-containing protein n=1 Tax=Lyophyllum shimeji TaxID=47721 RepID=A0A9P3UL89_LYOSH|nr:hypothetical protein LshimejAT787_0601410 [Lyophyllum shimeji]
MSFAPLTASDVSGLNVNYYLSIIAFTLLLYDYVLTFIAEVERFWSVAKRPTWAIVFFFANRYITLLGHVPVMIEYFWYSTAPDKPLMSILVSTLIIMRMYALYDRSRRVLALYLTVACAAAIVAVWTILTSKAKERALQPPEYFIAQGCNVTLSKVSARYLGGAWGGMLVFDTFVFAGTVYKSFTLRRIHGVGLITLLLRDGSVYFGVIIASNIANILTFIYGDTFTRGVCTTFTNIISSLMITRLMLNLRNPRLLGSAHPTSITTAAFRSRRESSQIMSTFLDFRNGTEFTQFTTDTALWSSQYYRSRGVIEEFEEPREDRENGGVPGGIELVPRPNSSA